MSLTFVTGPVRSGKSRFAERVARDSGLPVVYCATARLYGDDEFSARIARHAARRPPEWEVVETAAPGGPQAADVIARADAGTVVIVDSLGTWLAAEMDVALELHGRVDEETLDASAAAFADVTVAARAARIVVGEEVGWDIVPEYPSGRIFRDVLGRLQQRLARAADAAYLVVCGYALDLKLGVPVD